MNWEKIVEDLSLEPHPEGGFYRQTYKSEIRVQTDRGERSASTAIYFLITPGSVSRLHKIASDEVWHFYGGSPLEVVELVDGGGAKVTRIGSSRQDGCVPQYVVPGGTWFGSYPVVVDSTTTTTTTDPSSSTYALVGCTVAPGFEFEDFEMGSRAKLLSEFPNAKDLIIKLTEGLP